MTMLDQLVADADEKTARETRALCDPLQMPLTAQEWTNE